MSPAFSSTRQAILFVFVVCVLLAAPVILAKTSQQKRNDVYTTIPWEYGPFPWIQKKIFSESKDVDVAFMGSSLMWSAINTPYVQGEFKKHLGRDVEVFTLGWPWPGFDCLYFIARDLLDHRHVRMLVIGGENFATEAVHVQAKRWFRFGENSEAFEGLPLVWQIRLYGAAVLGAPRQILSLIRPNLLDDPAEEDEDNYWVKRYRSRNFEKVLGSLPAKLANDHSPNFVECHYQGSATPDDAIDYSESTRNSFEFSKSAIGPYQLHFAHKLAALCRERGTHLVFLHTPVLNEQGKAVVLEREFWPDLLKTPVDIVGIPPVRLFAGIPNGEEDKYFFENSHPNQNGQELFTPLITPRLLQIYDKSKNDRPR